MIVRRYKNVVGSVEVAVYEMDMLQALVIFILSFTYLFGGYRTIFPLLYSSQSFSGRSSMSFIRFVYSFVTAVCTAIHTLLPLKSHSVRNFLIALYRTSYLLHSTSTIGDANTSHLLCCTLSYNFQFSKSSYLWYSTE